MVFLWAGGAIFDLSKIHIFEGFFGDLIELPEKYLAEIKWFFVFIGFHWFHKFLMITARKSHELQ